MEEQIVVEVQGDTGVVIGAADPYRVALKSALDQSGEQPCYCPFCEKRIISENRRCPGCGMAMWGYVVLDGAILP